MHWYPPPSYPSFLIRSLYTSSPCPPQTFVGQHMCSSDSLPFSRPFDCLFTLSSWALLADPASTTCQALAMLSPAVRPVMHHHHHHHRGAAHACVCVCGKRYNFAAGRNQRIGKNGYLMCVSQHLHLSPSSSSSSFFFLHLLHQSPLS